MKKSLIQRILAVVLTLILGVSVLGNVIAMENVTTNYLVGEQQVCNTWANYINSSSLTAEQAIGFVRDSITSPEIMAHILVAGDSGVSGLSTTARP